MQSNSAWVVALACAAAVLCPGSGAPASVPGPSAAADAVRAATRDVRPQFAALPLLLVENRGQTDAPQVVAYAKGRGITVYFTPTGVTYALVRDGRRFAVKADFVGAAAGVRPELRDAAETTVSYFKGARPNWRTGIPTYREIRYAELWPGIDLVFRTTQASLKYEFRVAPGADPARIRMAWRGAEKLRVDGRGALAISTPLGGFEDEAPSAWQDADGARRPVAAAFSLEPQEDRVLCDFRLGAYDRALPLVIDPVVVVYAGFIGGGEVSNDPEQGNAIAVDAQRNAYVAGRTSASEATFPDFAGPDLTYAGADDAFVAKVRADGTALIYAGYIGGDSFDGANGIAVDAAGNAYVTGVTTSDQATFPATVGPDVTQNGGTDAFVAKVSPTGGSLLWCGYVGGQGGDSGSAIAVDKDGAAYVGGSTRSPPATFPAVTGPDLTYAAGNSDGFVAKVRPDGTGLVYAGYVGGLFEETVSAIAVDAAGAAYVAGTTEVGFPAVAGPDLTYNGGFTDAFVAKVRADGTGFEYAGLIGGAGRDSAAAIAVDTQGSAYVAGKTDSTQSDFPVTVGPDLTHSGGTDAFVAKVSPDGTALAWCGYIGGSGDDAAAGICVDAAGSARVTGVTSSAASSFPAAAFPDLVLDGGGDGFLARIAADGTGLRFCGYVGGTGGGDRGSGVVLDAGGNAYVVGVTDSTAVTFPVVNGPALVRSGATDVFVAKVSEVPDAVESFFLPKRIKAAVNTKDASKSTLLASGFFDTGTGIVDLTQHATLVVGGFTFDIPALVSLSGGKSFIHAAPGISFTITPNTSGSSRAKFKLKATGDFSGKVDLFGPLPLRFTQGALDSKGDVALKNGHFGLGTRPGRGALVEPNLYLLSATATLKGAGQDALSVVVGLATKGTTPDKASDVEIAFGDRFLAAVPAASFAKKGDSYLFRGNAGGVTSVFIDYVRETIQVTCKNLDLGDFTTGGNSVRVTVGLGFDRRSIRIRMARTGATMAY